jgi:hypothetical protein
MVKKFKRESTERLFLEIFLSGSSLEISYQSALIGLLPLFMTNCADWDRTEQRFDARNFSPFKVQCFDKIRQGSRNAC